MQCVSIWFVKRANYFFFFAALTIIIQSRTSLQNLYFSQNQLQRLIIDWVKCFNDSSPIHSEHGLISPLVD